jgi:hypothetical protein
MLTGCNTAGDFKAMTPHQQIEVVCTTIGSAYAATAELNAAHPLSAATKAKLLDAVAITDKTCLDIPYSWGDVAPGFSDAAGLIDRISQGKQP